MTVHQKVKDYISKEDTGHLQDIHKHGYYKRVPPEQTRSLPTYLTSSPRPVWHQGPVSRKTIFPRTGGWGWGAGFGMIQAHYIYCALYF